MLQLEHRTSTSKRAWARACVCVCVCVSMGELETLVAEAMRQGSSARLDVVASLCFFVMFMLAYGDDMWLRPSCR